MDARPPDQAMPQDDGKLAIRRKLDSIVTVFPRSVGIDEPCRTLPTAAGTVPRTSGEQHPFQERECVQPKCRPACRVDADRRVNSLIFKKWEGSKFHADSQQVQKTGNVDIILSTFSDKYSNSRGTTKAMPGACAVGIHGCKSALNHALDRSISSNMARYSPQSIGQGRGDIEFSLSRLATAQACMEQLFWRYRLPGRRAGIRCGPPAR